MDDFTNHFRNSLKKPLAPSSEKMKLKQIEKVIGYAGGAYSLTDIITLLSDHEFIIEIIELKLTGKSGKEMTVNSKLSYINAIIHATLTLGLKDALTEYMKYEKQLGIRRLTKERDNPIKVLKLSFEITDRILNDHKEKYRESETISDLRDLIKVKILTTYPFRMETGSLENILKSNYDLLNEVNEIEGRNFLVRSDNNFFFSFNKYKTYSRHGNRTIHIEDRELKSLLKKYLENLNDNDFLFWDGELQDNDTIETVFKKSTNHLSVWTKRMLSKYGVQGSATDFSKLLIDDVWENGSVADKERFAAWRGHEVATAAKVYATSK